MPSPAQSGSPRKSTHARTPSLVNVNNNTSWLTAPGVWASYLSLLLLCWLALVGPLGVARAWDLTVLAHFALTFPMFHWLKGSPIGADQGAYDKLTFWEQMDGGLQLTRTKKFFTAVPLVMLIPSWQRGDHGSPMGVATLAATAILLIAKTPFMHKVRIFGINSM